MSQARLSRALDGKGEPDVYVLRGARPPLLDGKTVRAVLAPFMAAVTVAAAVLRERMESGPLDLLAVALRTVAFAFVVRAVIELIGLARRWAADARAGAQALAWDAEGLLWRSPDGTQYVPKAAVAAVVTAPARAPGSARRRARPVWIVRWPGRGSPCLTLPPYFASDSEVLLARLQRWLGETPLPEASESDLPDEELVARARSQTPTEGVSVVKSARHLLHRAPLGWLLAVVFAIDIWWHAPPSWREALQLPLLAMTSLALLAPLAWAWLVARRTRQGGGIALVLTATHAIALPGGEPTRLDWYALQQAEATYLARWSPWTGAYTVSHAELHGDDGTRWRYDGALIDTPVEVVVAIARRLGELPEG